MEDKWASMEVVVVEEETFLSSAAKILEKNMAQSRSSNSFGVEEAMESEQEEKER